MTEIEFNALAAQGIPTLRFDWHGTGDSAGSDSDPSRRAAWHQNIRDAVAWMRSKLGCRRISIVGLAGLAPGKQVECVVTKPDGTERSFLCNQTMSDEHIEWFRAGSALNIIRARTQS